MKYNFDKKINRYGYSAYKTDLCVARFGTNDLLPLWVADMDFATPDFILKAIKKRTKHKVMGYTIRRKDFFVPIIDWLQKKHQWEIQSQWIGFVQGVVPGIALAVNEFTEKGDAIIVQTPVYPPFMSVITNNDRTLICNELVYKDGVYNIDFEIFEKQIVDNEVKMFIFCSPHNPGGRVWTKNEQEMLCDICIKHNVLVVSDEIHADLALFNHKHIPFASISEMAKQNSITLMAPSKTFNMPGLCSSFFIIPNDEKRKRFQKIIQNLECGGGNLYAYEATTAAYRYGKQWLNELIEYLEENVNYVDDFIRQNIPQLKIMKPQASFLIWIDFKALNLKDSELQHLLIYDAKLGLNDGPSFGQGGGGFARLNIACPRSILKEAMRRLKMALDKK